MKSQTRKWINFARYTSPPIGKARCLEAVIYPGHEREIRGVAVEKSIYLRILYDDGHEYEGYLTRIQEEEE